MDTPSQFTTRISEDFWKELQEMCQPTYVFLNMLANSHRQRDAIRRHEASTRGVGDDVMKHHVNAIIEDDFWQVVKEEKLQEGDFEVESLMSFGGSHWCRSTPTTEHRSTYTNQNRSTEVPEHRSTTPTESTASCNAVKILTHKEFAAKHPHPPSPDNV
ncbi:hypothetical protein F2Q70_00034645 [Brassica cretica]|uniref:Uncharacterized protein n=2 Tax=Brassica cretica TaxID=69181 RepID=A0A8S9K1J1_BRACR|nr:hypothetical protein F2Q70_00034645 [Brassica cretica]